MIIAKPNLFNNNDLRKFENDQLNDAVKYLQSRMPDDYPKMALEDWVMVGKLYRDDGVELCGGS